MNNSIAAYLLWAKHYLDNESARLEAEILMSAAINQPRSYLLTWPEYLLAEDEITIFKAFIEKRKMGHPIAYLLGEQEFWSLSFKVNASTLIPRPETEQLIDAVLERFPIQTSLTVLDAGTGSGAIAIALQKERPRWQLMASDLSNAALTIAAENAQTHQVMVTFFQASWLACMANNSIDVLVSNPPYIEENDRHLADLQFEPITALVAKDHGLADIITLVAQARRVLKPCASVYIEHGFQQGAAVRDIFLQQGFVNIHTAKDYAGLERFSYAENACYE